MHAEDCFTLPSGYFELNHSSVLDFIQCPKISTEIQSVTNSDISHPVIIIKAIQILKPKPITVINTRDPNMYHAFSSMILITALGMGQYLMKI